MIADVDAFRAAWQAASTVSFAERPNAVVQRALDRLAEGVVARLSHGSTVQAALKPFASAVRAGDGMPSDFSNLQATAFRDGDRWLVNVAAGFASSVQAFDRTGKRLKVPMLERWAYRYAGPFRRVGPHVMFDGYSLQDAGVRYGYRLAFLRRTPEGYAPAGLIVGGWTYDDGGDAHLRLTGSRVVVRSLDSPKSFFVASPERLLRREETWDARGPSLRRVAVRLLDPDVRAVDDWLFAHRGGLLSGKRRLPSEPLMADGIKRSKGRVELSLDGLVLRFRLALRGGKNVVTLVDAPP